MLPIHGGCDKRRLKFCLQPGLRRSSPIVGSGRSWTRRGGPACSTCPLAQPHACIHPTHVHARTHSHNDGTRKWMMGSLTAAFATLLHHRDECVRLRHLLARHLGHWRYKAQASFFRTWGQNARLLAKARAASAQMPSEAPARAIALPMQLQDQPAAAPHKGCCQGCSIL